MAFARLARRLQLSGAGSARATVHPLQDNGFSVVTGGNQEGLFTDPALFARRELWLDPFDPRHGFCPASGR